MAEKAVAWIIYSVLSIPVYIYAAAVNFDNWKSGLLFVLAALNGLFFVGRLGIKFFKELLAVLVAYRAEKVEITDLNKLWIIIGLAVIVLILLTACIILLLSK